MHPVNNEIVITLQNMSSRKNARYQAKAMRLLGITDFQWQCGKAVQVLGLSSEQCEYYWNQNCGHQEPIYYA